MPRGKGSKDWSRGNATSKYREAWAEGAYNRENSEDEENEHEGPQPVRDATTLPLLINCIAMNSEVALYLGLESIDRS